MRALGWVLLLGATACGGGDDRPPPDAGAILTVEGFATPESVLHDPTADVYLVSNIQGDPRAKDGNGFISRVLPDGSVPDRRWIAGGQGGVILHAPKGMALWRDVLWVADIDHLRRFDRRTGAPAGEVPIEGASFLNDVAVGADGTVYVSDTGLGEGLSPDGRDAIYAVGGDGTVRTLVKGPELGLPNGIVAQPSGIYAVNWGDGAFFQVDYQGRLTELVRAPRARLDGLVRTAEGQWFGSSWDGGCIYRFDLQGQATVWWDGLEQPADLGYDAGRNTLLVPLFGSDRVLIRRL